VPRRAVEVRGHFVGLKLHTFDDILEAHSSHS
jgi:hypothetical protein